VTLTLTLIVGVSREDLLLLSCDYEMQMFSWEDQTLLKAYTSKEESMRETTIKELDSSVVRVLEEEATNLYASADGSYPGHCTAFAVTQDRTQGKKRPGLCAQNVDEAPWGWLDGEKDVVFHHKTPETGLETMLYTHPGVPAYCGMNNRGGSEIPVDSWKSCGFQPHSNPILTPF